VKRALAGCVLAAIALGAVATTAVAAETRVKAVAFADLPRVALPQPAQDAQRPKKLEERPLPEDLLLKAPPTAPGMPSRTRTAREPVSMAVELARPGLAGFTFDRAAVGRGLNVSCGGTQTYGYYAQVHSIRWERVSLSEGGLVVDTADGWFDPRSCAISAERRSNVALRTLVTASGVPVAVAVRGDDDVTLFFPGEAQIAVDTSAGSPPVTRGTLARVTLPARKGFAGSALAVMPSSIVARWAAALGKPLSEPAAAELTVAVDVVQTVSDEAPIITARASTR